jgi:hypothetical protein
VFVFKRAIARVVFRSAGTCVVVAAMAASWSIPGDAQSRRRGGPSDWSHARIMAARFGPDGDRNIDKNWRSARKQMQLQWAQQAREANRDGWLDLIRGGAGKSPAETAAPHLDWSLRTGGYGNVVGSPAKYSFDISAYSCSDVVYFTVDQPGSASAVNLIAITNAYAGCTGNALGTTPTVKFGIALPYGTATSAVPSFDGTVLYVIESRPSANGGPILHAINVNNITTTPGAYSFATNTWTQTHTLSSSPIGTASSDQLFQLTYAGITNDVASPYLDYDTNQIFFGDSVGHIHRVTGVGASAAAKYTANGFPVLCGAAQVQSPVYWNNQIYTTSADGRVYRIDLGGVTPYASVASYQGGSGTGSVGGGLSAPVLDVTNGKIVTSSNDINGSGGRAYGVFNMQFASGEAPTSYTFTGPSTTTIAPVSPAFDDAFWSTNNGSLYGAATNAAGTNTYLIRLSYNGEVGNIIGNAALAHSGGVAVVGTSPVTEFLTGAASNPDFIFVGGSTGNYKSLNRIGAGFTGTDATPSAMASSFAPAQGVLSGIIIDTNLAAMTGNTAKANIYFGTIGVASTTMSTIVQLAQAF